MIESSGSVRDERNEGKWRVKGEGIEEEEERNARVFVAETSASVVSLFEDHKFLHRWQMHFSGAHRASRLAQVDSFSVNEPVERGPPSSGPPFSSVCAAFVERSVP